MNLKSTGLSYTISIIVIIIYSFYIVSVQGVTGLLLSFAVGMITAAFLDSLELIVAVVILVGLLYDILMRRAFIRNIRASGQNGQKEGFAPGMGTGKGISNLVVELEEGRYKPGKVKAVYSDGADQYASVRPGPSVRSSEGFQNQGDDEEEEGESAESTPAPKAEAANTSKQVDSDAAAVAAATSSGMPSDSPAGSASAASGSIQPSAASGAAKSDGFTSGASGLFKLGKMPSESSSGPHVDVAATMSKALSALQPEQMAAMTAESNSLLETQRNLMNMLQSMRPVIQDGRQLLDTFSGIFGNLGGMKGPSVI